MIGRMKYTPPENATCLLCNETVRQDDAWTRTVVFFDAQRNAILCTDCVSRVVDLAAGARIGLYLGPGRERV